MGKTPAFCYPTIEGVCLSPEEIGSHVDVAMDLVRGTHGLCELALANRKGEVDYDDETLFRVVHAAMEKTIETVTHLLYCQSSAMVEKDEAA